MKQLTWEETQFPEDPRPVEIAMQWFARGDGMAVYENFDLGHPDLGHRQFVSFGSPEAQLEVEEPPQTLPDIGGHINWRYQLVGVYRPGNDREVQFGTLQPDGKVTEERKITHASLQNCPHVIFMPVHYRDDGTCRCDDPAHHEMSEWGYEWDPEKALWT